MILEIRDVEALRLAGRYRWLPCRNLEKFGFHEIQDELCKLVKHGLLNIAKSGEYVMLSTYGYELLQKLGFVYTPGGRRAYASSPTLRRRFETADIMLTALRAGIYTLSNDIEALREQPTFYPAFALRPAIMNSSSCCAFGHWGNTAYMVQYISPTNPGFYRVSEFTTFENLSSVFRASTKEPMGMLLAGSSYLEIYKQLASSVRSERHGKRGFADFGDMYGKLGIPMHLVACNETGAKQLAVMCHQDYRVRIARTAYGQQWRERDPDIPDADGCVGDIPIVIAVDMDIHRAETVVNAVMALQRREVRIAAFEEQILEVLHPMFPRDKPGNIVSLLRIGDDMLDAAFNGMRLYNMDTGPARDRGGGFIYA